MDEMQQWIEANRDDAWALFDYIEACIDEETDIGVRFDRRISWDALRDALEAAMAERRIRGDAPLFAEVEVA